VRTLAFLSGIHSRSEELIDSTKAFDRAEISDSRLEMCYREDTRKLIGLEVEAELDFICDGMLRWHDPLRPFIRSLEGVVPGPYYRWFETNTFFRKPIVKGELSIAGNSLEQLFFLDLLPSDKDSLVVLPGPYTLSRLSEDEYYGDVLSLVPAYAKTLDYTVRRLSSARKLGVVLSEPCLVYDGTRPDKKVLSVIVEEIEKIASNSSFCLVHTYFGDASKILNLLDSFSKPWIGVDLTETYVEALNAFHGKKVALGILDSLSPIVETPSSLKRLFEKVKKIDFASIAFCPNTDLRYLPREISDNKIRSLKLLKKMVED
jgi:5-methyltetrahydropteroyltriglutamate--homocysteine methyltransferase